jgi:hypothetical protein
MGGLDGGAADAHRDGWDHYLNRLRRTAEGETEGADPEPSHRHQIGIR